MTAVDRLNGINSGLAYKAPVRVATTANITLSGEQTIDGVAVVSGDRVLVKNQSTASQNGIYVASTGAWSRAKDFDGSRDIVKGTQVFVAEGTVNIGSGLYVSTTGTICTDSLAFSFSAGDSSPSNLLSSILTVDGAGSNLDADKLDGEQGSYYLDRANHTGTQAISTVSGLQTALDDKQQSDA